MSALLPCTRVLGMRGRAEKPEEGRRWERFQGGGGLLTCSFTNPLLVPCKLKPHHLVSFPTFVFSVFSSSLFLPAVSFSNHRPGTVWLNEGLGSTLLPPQASVQLGKDCPLLWWDTVAKSPVGVLGSWFRQVYLGLLAFYDVHLRCN